LRAIKLKGQDFQKDNNIIYLFFIGKFVIPWVFIWVFRGLEAQSGHTKDYKIGICCLSTKQTALRKKS